MSRIPYLCCERATYLLRTFGAIPCRKSHVSCLSKRNDMPVLYFLRRFKLASCLSKGKDFDKSGNNGQEHVSISNEQSCVNGCSETSKSSKNLILKDDVCSHAQSSTGMEFLGIEVYPEIFDQLPPKCSGCGAILQSDYESKPGYIPKDKNPSFSFNNEENALMPETVTVCTRCFSIKHYNKDVPPMVTPESISKFLSHISRRKALILYNVDVMDIPGSFIPDILSIVGETKHLILVCNKIDRLAVDGHPQRQMERTKKIILNEAVNFGLKNANIKDVCMISAKTGLGVRDLVKMINKFWRKSSDIYIVGSNNSGKTTLFNLLADLFAASRFSDDMLQRGTASHSPGNTLSLLRFPITQHRFLRLQDRLRHGYSEVILKLIFA